MSRQPKTKTLRATAWILLVIWTDMGLTKNMGDDYQSLEECKTAWEEQLKCYKEEVKDPKKTKYKEWGQPSGFCIKGERFTAPGILYPTRDEGSGCG